jgi:hypothetical protein
MTQEKAFKKNRKDNQGSLIINMALSHSKEIVSAVIIGVIVTVISTLIVNGGTNTNDGNQAIGSQSPSSQGATQTNRAYMIRSQLGQVLSTITMAKMYLSEYYMMEGTLPTTSKQFDIARLDLNESQLIDKAYLVSSGIGVSLSKTFGTDKRLALIAVPSKSGARLNWRCETNIEQKYLGIGGSNICDFNANVPSN